MSREHNPPIKFPPGISGRSLLGTYSSWSSGMILVFLTSRRIMPDAARTDTTLINPSAPGKVSTILPIGHCFGFELSSTSNTKSPSNTFFVDRCHFDIRCSDRAYSVCHLMRNSCERRYTNCQRDNDEICRSSKLISGTVARARPMRR